MDWCVSVPDPMLGPLASAPRAFAPPRRAPPDSSPGAVAHLSASKASHRAKVARERGTRWQPKNTISGA